MAELEARVGELQNCIFTGCRPRYFVPIELAGRSRDGHHLGSLVDPIRVCVPLTDPVSTTAEVQCQTRLGGLLREYESVPAAATA